MAQVNFDLINPEEDNKLGIALLALLKIYRKSNEDGLTRLTLYDVIDTIDEDKENARKLGFPEDIIALTISFKYAIVGKELYRMGYKLLTDKP